MIRFALLRARIAVLAKALPTWLVAASTLVATIAPQVAQAFPESAQTITAASLRLGALLAAATVIVRSVTPVRPSQRGLLADDGGDG